MAKYHIERLINGRDLAFYIDDSLQFDTRDEYVYHESLFLPPVALMAKRKAKPLKGLVLGGGDGLGLRDVLAFSQTQHVDLVDYDPEVVRLAKNEWKEFNQASLHDPRVSVHIQEASQFLHSRQAAYDYIVADFTFPQDLAGCSLFTRDFFRLLAERLQSKGVMAINTFSPQNSAEAFWSVYRTLSSAGLYPKPYHIHIPSFLAHGYGQWGFFLASRTPLLQKELQAMHLPPQARYLKQDMFMKTMSFESSAVWHGMNFGRIVQTPHDLKALLNAAGIFAPLGGDLIDFSKDMMPAEIWRYYSDHPEHIFFSMSTYWKERVLALLQEMDWEQLVKEAEKSIKDYSLQTKETISDLFKDKETYQKAVYALLAAIIITNLLCPDNAFAKGYYGGHYHGGSGGSTTLSLMAPVTATPFFTSVWLNQNNVPNMSGGAQPKKIFLVEQNRSEKAFFALNDTVYLTQGGDVFSFIERTQFFYKVEPDQLVLYKQDQPGAIVSLALEEELAGEIEKSIEAHRKVLASSIRQFERWLNWSGPGEFLAKEIADEKAELVKLKQLEKILDHLSQTRLYGGSSSYIDGPSTKLAAGVRLTLEGELLVKATDGIWKGYAFRNFQPKAGREILPSNAALDVFFEELLTKMTSQLRIEDPLRALIQERLGTFSYGISLFGDKT